MSTATLSLTTSNENTLPDRSKLYKTSAVAALLQLAVVLVYFVVIATVG